MTFRTSAWAIDGPLTRASQAREQTYVASAGAEGIAQSADLKVSQLASPGNGLRIGPGGAIILNRYLGLDPDQSYTVSNPDTHTVGAGDMPGSQPTDKQYLVVVTIGDPDYSQTGHPWMASDDPPAGEESSFVYVRPKLIQCPSGTEHFAELGLLYPGYALARVAIPAGVTTITDAMITDLREMATPRTAVGTSIVAASGTPDPLEQAAGTWANWPNVVILQQRVPRWATKAKVFGFVEGARWLDGGGMSARVVMRQGSTILAGGPATNVIDTTAVNGGRINYTFAAEFDIAEAQRGEILNFVAQGTPGAGSVNKMQTDGNTTAYVYVTYEEVPT